MPCQFCVLNPSYFPFLKIFPRAFFGSGPVVHSGGDGRTGGGGPGGLGVHGGMGIFIPLFLSLGACCRRFLATMTSKVEYRFPLRTARADWFTTHV